MSANPAMLGEWIHIPEQGEGPAKEQRSDECIQKDDMAQLAVLAQRVALKHKMTRVQVLESLSETIMGSARKPDTSGTPATPVLILGEDVLFIGKHKGKTYVDIAENDPCYLKWVLTNPEEGMSVQLKHFRKWLEVRYRQAKFNKSGTTIMVRKSDSLILVGPMAGRVMPAETAEPTEQKFDDHERKTMEENVQKLLSSGLPSSSASSKR